MPATRPRIALVGLDGAEAESLEALCAESRRAPTWGSYAKDYAASETDAAVARQWASASAPVHLMAIEPAQVGLAGYSKDGRGIRSPRPVFKTVRSTERSVSVGSQCPNLYNDLAAAMARRLGSSDEPPPVFQIDATRSVNVQVLVKTTSGYPVALRAELDLPGDSSYNEHRRVVVLALPDIPDAAAWFRAFLADVHAFNSDRVPQLPPTLATPQTWYTPAERRIAERISEINSEIEQLVRERESCESELHAAGVSADANQRRAIWDDGESLRAAVVDILRELGFDVREMDAFTPPGQPKREDLRLKHLDWADWEAIVEVKGYSNGTKTSDARQLREYRDRYIREEHRPPDLTLWIANPYRGQEPSSRPEPDANVHTAAETIDAVHVLATDLYRLWVLVVSDQVEPSVAADALRNATPGLWQL